MVSDPDFQMFPPWVLFMWDVWGTPLSLFKMFEDRASAPKTRSRCQLLLDVLC
jgi:hypothetical protein